MNRAQQAIATTTLPVAIRFRWGISKGRNTPGYRTCSIYADNVRITGCNGGGYDMRGTAFGDYLAVAFADRLRKIKTPHHGLTFHNPTFDPGNAVPPVASVWSAISASSKLPTDKHTVPLIDGACGFNTVERIAEKIGLQLVQAGKTDHYTLRDTPDLFVHHRCWECNDGRLPCKASSYYRCDNPRARND